MRRVHEFDNGVKVHDDHLMEVQRQRYRRRNVHEEDEEALFLDVIRNLQSGASFVNVGSAIGYYPLLARKNRKDIAIHCFEPLPRHRRQFQENIRLNGFSDAEFSVYDVAVSVRCGDSLFEDTPYAGSIIEKRRPFSATTMFKRLLKKFAQTKAGTSVVKVRTIRLADLFQTIGTRNIDFLQMDIQGHELPVWTEYFATSRPSSDIIESILLGTHGAEIHGRCRRLFEENGYAMIHDEGETPNQPDGILYCSLRRTKGTPDTLQTS